MKDKIQLNTQKDYKSYWTNTGSYSEELKGLEHLVPSQGIS